MSRLGAGVTAAVASVLLAAFMMRMPWRVVSADRIQSVKLLSAARHDAFRISLVLEDRYVVVVSGVNRRRVQSLEHGARVDLAEFSPDASEVISADASGHVSVWRARDATRLRVHEGSQPIVAINFSPRGDRYLMADARGLHVFDSATGRRTDCTAFTSGNVWTASFDPAGDFILAGSWEGGLTLLEVDCMKRVQQLPWPTGVPAFAAFSSDGKYIIGASLDGARQLYERRWFPPRAAVIGVLLLMCAIMISTWFGRHDRRDEA